MKKSIKRVMAWMVLLSMVALVFPVRAQAADADGGKRYNIMLVIDGSGSLTSADCTDPDGLRYELVGELLGILEDDGHNIGAIVFSGTQSKSTAPTDEIMEEGIRLNTGLMSLDELAPDGRDPKGYLEDEIRKVDVDTAQHGCTDIGTALKVAQEQLLQMQEENGLESVVFLFTDGNTTFYKNPAAIVEKSNQNMDEATLSMSSNGIRLFGAFLNQGGKLDDTEMQRLVCAANGISVNSSEFQYSYVELQNASGIHQASTQFLQFLGYIGDEEPMILYDNYTATFTIPGVGVEEMNIRLYSPDGEDLPAMNIQIIQPDGTTVTGVAMKGSRTYRVYKLTQPMSGEWRIEIQVPEGNRLAYVYAPVISLYVNSQLEVEPDLDQLHVGMDAEVSCLLAQGSTVCTDPAAYYGYDCVLQVRNVANGATERYEVTMNAVNEMKQLLELNDYGLYEVVATFTCGDIQFNSSTVMLDLSNWAPEVTKNVSLHLSYGLFQSETETVDLTQCFDDPEDGSDLTYSFTVDGCDAQGCKMDGTELILTKALVGNGKILVTATDSQGASVVGTITVQTSSVTMRYVLCMIAVLILIVVVALCIYAHKPRPNGELKVSFNVNQNGKELPVDLNLLVPGSDTKSKTNLWYLLMRALQADDTKINSSLYARDVKECLNSYKAECEKISLSADAKKKNRKMVGAVCAKRGGKKKMLCDSSAEYALEGITFVLTFALPQDTMGNPFDDNGIPYPGQSGQQDDNLFDDLNNWSAEAPTGKRKSRAKGNTATPVGGNDTYDPFADPVRTSSNPGKQPNAEDEFNFF